LRAPSLKRDVAALEREIFDLLVIGGGIVGACVARDAARRGLSVALIERCDFSSGTSAASSKLVHGGLRYLKRLELRLVREALGERRLWAINAPHLVRPMPFFLPLPARAASRAVLRAALSLYDAVAFDKSRIADPRQRVKGHEVLDAAQARSLEPLIGDGAEGGAIIYYDYQMESPERLGLECVIDAATHGAEVANYIGLAKLVRSPSGNIAAAVAHDSIGRRYVEIRAQAFVNATGPWADLTLADALDAPLPFSLRRSKGIHLVARSFLQHHAVALTADGRHLFAVPWRGRTLIGTTDTAYDGEAGPVPVTAKEEAELLQAFARMLPRAELGEADIVHRYAGVRPLIGRSERGGDTYGASREAEIVDHARAGGPANLYSAIGGKWTTARLIAERMVDLLAKGLGRRFRPCDTRSARLPNAPPGSIEEHERAMRTALAEVESGAADQLMRSYGAAAAQVAAAARGKSDLRRLEPGLPHIPAELVYAARHEMAMTVDDLLFRRTSIAPLGGGTTATRNIAEAVLG
jgi:glycerol-3-phosphate dehydrogenase